MVDGLLSFNVAAFTPDIVFATGQTAGGNGAHGGVVIPGIQKSRSAYIRVRYSGLGNAAGTTTILFKSQAYHKSPQAPNAAGWFDQSADGQNLLTFVNGTPASSSAVSGEFYIPVVTSAPEVRLAYAFNGGTTPTVTFIADLVFSNV